MTLPPLLQEGPLEAFLDAHGLGAGPLAAEPIGEGHSNATFLVRHRWVLRRPPRGPLPPSAHDVLREARLLQALEGAPVRVPRVVATCADETVTGAPFYVMERVEGDVLQHALPPAIDDPASRARIADELVDALVEVHAVDWRERGLAGYGKPTGYLERQLRRFSGLWDALRTRDIPALDEVTRRLASRVPESGPATIVHGDFRLGNTMFARGAPPRLVAIFDWELATIGDPLADVGYLAATWAQPGEEDQTMFALGAVTRLPGFPPREALVARYEERSGRRMTDLRWYMALALWKSAIFLEGSYRRRLAGTTEDAFFDRLETGVPELAERALAIARMGTDRTDSAR